MSEDKSKKPGALNGVEEITGATTIRVASSKPATLVVSPSGRKYGRSVPPPLPVHRMLTRVSPMQLPPAIDLRPWAGSVKDQGAEGSCTGQADTSGGEWIWRKYLGQTPVFSPQYTYAKELQRNGNFPSDVGSDGETACLTAIADGFCPAELYPYVAGKIAAPTSEQDMAARLFRLGAYHGVLNAAVAQSVLGDPVPWPIMIGFTVYESFESDAVTATGVVPVPGPGERVLGGHEVLILGYDLGADPMLRPAAAGPSFLCQNSWGTGWGQRGYFWMPKEVLDFQDTDLKIAHHGGPWR